MFRKRARSKFEVLPHIIFCIECMVIIYMILDLEISDSIFALILLFVSSYGYGSLFNKDEKTLETIICQTAVGLGLLGVLLYFVFLFGIGYKLTVCVLVLLGVIISILRLRKDYSEIFLTAKHVIEYGRNHLFFGAVFIGFMVVYLLYGSLPITDYDALTKHLPIVVSAVEHHAWYLNVSEAIVYGEPMVLQYTYAIFFYMYGCYKALKLFNVVVFALLVLILCLVSRKISNDSTDWFVACIIISTPFFFQYATAYMLDILPVFFVFSAILRWCDLEPVRANKYMLETAFLLGCSLFTKLTGIFLAILIACLTFGLALRDSLQKKNIRDLLIKSVFSICLGGGMAVISMLNVWYWTGNPLFPMFNGMFKSPYFDFSNFQDPYTSRLSFSLRSLFEIVFHTSLHGEVYDGVLGYFLLALLGIPIVLFLMRKDKNTISRYGIWVVVLLVAYFFNTKSSYNIRYYYSTIFLAFVLCAVGISYCFKKIKIKWVSHILLMLISLFLTITNLLYFQDYYQKSLEKDDRIVNNAYCEILSEIPQGSRVFAITVSNEMKGAFNGYYTSDTWQNGLIYNILGVDYSYDEYLLSFDYFLIDKLQPKEQDMLFVQKYLGNVVAENEYCTLYEKKINYETMLGEDQLVNIEAEFGQRDDPDVFNPCCFTFYNTDHSYALREEIENLSDVPQQLVFQINWHDVDGNQIGVYQDFYTAEPQTGTYYSNIIAAQPDASFGIIYVYNMSDGEIRVNDCKIFGLTFEVDAVANENDLFNNRRRINANAK